MTAYPKAKTNTEPAVLWFVLRVFISWC